MYLLHIDSDDGETVKMFDCYSDVVHYVVRLDLSNVYLLDCYECGDCVNMLKYREEKK